jgi:NADPH-dependent ferric siderophore reductase
MKTYTVKVDDDKTEWHINGKLHREDGPSVEWSNGTKYWHRNDKLHREDGPAIEWANGNKSWYLHGERVTENDVMTDNNQTIEIEGTKYTLAQIKNALKKSV